MAESICFLVGAGATSEAEERLAALVRTTDGFELAEVDLDLRGGHDHGERQKGRNDLKLASLRRDREWVTRAREVAFELVGADPDLSTHPSCATRSSYSSARTPPPSSSRADVSPGRVRFPAR
ncbi:MAG: hypothetical protein WKF43_16410 [Acidimicrobiales bacterium]